MSTKAGPGPFAANPTYPVAHRTFVGPRKKDWWADCHICAFTYPLKQLVPYKDRQTGEPIPGLWQCKNSCNDKLPLHDLKHQEIEFPEDEQRDAATETD